MMKLDLQAEELNQIIKTRSETVYGLLSRRGKAIYFPRGGILAQGMTAKDKEINTTLGVAYEGDGKPMVLPRMTRRIALGNENVFLTPQAKDLNRLGRNRKS